MDALHKLISFGAGPESALPDLTALMLGALPARKLQFIRRFQQTQLTGVMNACTMNPYPEFSQVVVMVFNRSSSP